jgi:hypothetical protein
MNDDHLDHHDGDGLWMAPDPLPLTFPQTWGEVERQDRAFWHWLEWLMRQPRHRPQVQRVLPAHLREFWVRAERGEV